VGEGEGEALPAAASSRARLMAGEAAEGAVAAGTSSGAKAQAANAASPADSLVAVLGSPSGVTLRRIAKDLDSTKLLLDLTRRAQRPARRAAANQLAQVLEAKWSAKLSRAGRRLKAGFGNRPRVVATGLPRAAAGAASAASGQAGGSAGGSDEVAPWPSSEAAKALEARRRGRAKHAGLLLLRSHLARQVAAGTTGLAALASLAFFVLRVGGAAVLKASLRVAVKALPAVALTGATALAAKTGADWASGKRRVGRAAKGGEAKGTEGGEQPTSPA